MIALQAYACMSQLLVLNTLTLIVSVSTVVGRLVDKIRRKEQ